MKKTSEAPSFLATNDSIYRKDPQKQSFIDYKRTSTLIPLERHFVAKSFWFEGIEKRERLTIPVVDHRPSSLVCRARSSIGGQLLSSDWAVEKKIPFLNLPHIRPHAVMKLSLRTAFLAAKSALAFNAWFFYYTRTTSKPRLHQMALSAWKATAQQSISNSAIQSSVKGMQKRRRRKKGHRRKKRREIVVSATEAYISPACRHLFFSTP